MTTDTENDSHVLTNVYTHSNTLIHTHQNVPHVFKNKPKLFYRIKLPTYTHDQIQKMSNRLGRHHQLSAPISQDQNGYSKFGDQNHTTCPDWSPIKFVTVDG